MLFTDRLYANVPEVRSGSVWLVIDGEDHVAHGKFGAGKVQSFDAEMLALAHGLREAVRDVPAHITTLIVCSDNQSALDQIFKPEVGPLQMAAVIRPRGPWHLESAPRRGCGVV
ncbi:hypothetical protein AcW1_010349 [Taiwanofungus camphoratus]|nr:hypothetical protein AcW2_010383 [Antrodia cinnamomea]KAI0952859.1 hypothetical protein AcW1_010349 [Antrodia cinnamomea]